MFKYYTIYRDDIERTEKSTASTENPVKSKMFNNNSGFPWVDISSLWPW